MATVTGLTKDRMLAIEAASIVDARKEGDDLVLTTHGGADINVGNIRGPQGDTGPAGFTVARIPAGADLDNYKTVGQYLQISSANATIPLHYPVAIAGMLEVGKDPLGTMTWQRYTTYGVYNRVYTRGFYDTSWNVWAEISVVGHNHDDRYFTESEITTLLAGKSETSHTHDDRYFTESEITTLLAGKSATSHTHDDRYFTESEITIYLAGKSDTSHNHDTVYRKKEATGLTTEDLDTVIVPGDYWQSSAVDATLARHYPVAAAAGLLEVSGDQSGARWVQRFTAHPATGSLSGHSWVRSGGTSLSWTAWRKLTTIVSGSGTTGYVQIENNLRQRGTISVSTTGGPSGSATLSFPITFASAPNIQFTVGNGNAFIAFATSLSASGCTVTIEHIAGSNSSVQRTVHWVAEGHI